MTAKHHEFVVLSAGLSRTGTVSLQRAFEVLCGGKCLHLLELLELDISNEISEVLSNKNSNEKIKKFFEKNNFRSGAGIAILGFWERVVDIYPNCKVVLTIRKPEEWVESCKSTLLLLCGKNHYRNRFPYTIFNYFPTKRNKILKLQEQIPLLTELCEALDNNKGVEFFNQWTAYVNNKVPKDRLLVYEIKDGWDPLCEFLGKPVPNEPFPVSNSRGFYKVNYIENQIRFESACLVCMLLIPASVGIYFIMDKHWKSVNSILQYCYMWFRSN